MRASRALALALVVMAGACGNKQDAPPATTAGSSAAPAGSASDPWAKPAGAPSVDAAAADTPCDDDDIRKHIDNGLAQSAAYLSALERRTARWKKDCEAAKQDLLALEPAAKQFVDAMLAFKAWGDTLSPACRKRVDELGEHSPVAAEIDKRTPSIEERVSPMLERCKDHPGFQDAAAKGLRVLRKKHPSP